MGTGRQQPRFSRTCVGLPGFLIDRLSWTHRQVLGQNALADALQADELVVVGRVEQELRL